MTTCIVLSLHLYTILSNHDDPWIYHLSYHPHNNEESFVGGMIGDHIVVGYCMWEDLEEDHID